MSKSSKAAFSNVSLSSILLYLKRHTYLAVAVVSWIIMILLSVLFVAPHVRLISSQMANITTEQVKLDTLSTKLTFLQSLDAPSIANQKALLQNVLPSQKPVTPLISSLEKLAADAGVTFKNFELSPGSVATGGATITAAQSAKGFVSGVGSLPLKLEVQGGFAQMNTFFKSLDTVIPLVNVKTISFTQVSQNGVLISDSTLYKAAVELESLYSLQDVSAIKADAAEVLVPLSTNDISLLNQLSSLVSAQPVPAQTVFIPVFGSEGTQSRPSIFSY